MEGTTIGTAKVGIVTYIVIYNWHFVILVFDVIKKYVMLKIGRSECLYIICLFVTRTSCAYYWVLLMGHVFFSAVPFLYGLG